ncbi:hypothetical protein ASF33_18965 [Methylobacterium sp. Leaf92]|nr:hypothetical protein ASF33_18965 [Methylobacterium sp. Leaf92]KQQ06649.1 hypothetical protein ASF59_01955 [Methylobacterium sp. Leaf121]
MIDGRQYTYPVTRQERPDLQRASIAQALDDRIMRQVVHGSHAPQFALLLLGPRQQASNDALAVGEW